MKGKPRQTRSAVHTPNAHVEGPPLFTGRPSQNSSSTLRRTGRPRIDLGCSTHIRNATIEYEIRALRMLRSTERTTMSDAGHSPVDAPSSVFDHSFGGWSVWIEACENESSHLFHEVEYLSEQCGGRECGLFPFVPHCTLLYNVSPDVVRKQNQVDDKDLSDEEIGNKVLEKCLALFREEGKQRKSTDDRNTSASRYPKLRPTQCHYFPYPTTADNGRGFGCVISMILLETSEWLSSMQQSVRQQFPPDERHGQDPTRDKTNGNTAISDTTSPDKGNQIPFIPHLAFVYAPEAKSVWLEAYTRDLENSKPYMLEPFRGRYLSIWSTNGKLSEWHCISRIEL